jgi:GT2 family glycosyltransferase
MVREDYPWVSLIASDENLGYGSAVNLVAARTTSDWLAAANDDTELHAGALERMLQTGELTPGAGAIAPRLLLPDGSTQQSVQSFPSITLGLLFNLGAYRLSRRLAERLCIAGYWNPDRRREVPWAMAAWLLVRRRAWNEVGGFDESQWMYAEDVDLAWRLREGGWTVVYEPEATVLHADASASKRAFGDEVIARHMASSYAWMARRRGMAFTRAVALLNVLGAVVRLAAVAPLVALKPARYRSARDHYRRWLRVHTVGLGPREKLLRHR